MLTANKPLPQSSLDKNISCVGTAALGCPMRAARELLVKDLLKLAGYTKKKVFI
jgi:hypothetical protein